MLPCIHEYCYHPKLSFMKIIHEHTLCDPFSIFSFLSQKERDKLLKTFILLFVSKGENSERSVGIFLRKNGYHCKAEKR